MKCWPEDGGKFITLPLVQTVDPNNGIPNLGMYRMHVYDDFSTGMHMQIGKGGGYHYQESESIGKDLPLAVTLGGDPVLTIASIMALPEGIGELEFAGLVRGKRTRLSKSKTIPNTFKAHRFIWYIKDQELQTKLSEALFYAHFTEGKDIGSTKVLGQIGADLGLDQKEIIKFLDSKEGGKEVADLEINAMESAITSVPTYIINDRFILHGGQESNTFVSFFKRVETILQKEK